MPTPPDFDALSSFQGLLAATKKAIKGKRRKAAATRFLQNMEWNLLALSDQLRSKTYKPSPYREIPIQDPKPRLVSVAAFRDRVVHHALYAQIEPVFERVFVFDTYANRKGKGTHAALRRYLHYADKFAHVLRCDIFRYFPAIDHAVLKGDLRRKITCPKILWLLDLIIDHSNVQEPVNVHFPGDDLLAPLERRRGLPIGNLTSQFFGNIYLNSMDHFIKEVLKIKGYTRYVDDFALFANDPGQLQDAHGRLAAFLAQRRLLLHPRKTHLQSTFAPTQFLGFDLPTKGEVRLPKANVDRLMDKVRKMRRADPNGWARSTDTIASIQGWTGHATHANTWRLRHAIFAGTEFDPAAKAA